MHASAARLTRRSARRRLRIGRTTTSWDFLVSVWDEPEWTASTVVGDVSVMHLPYVQLELAYHVQHHRRYTRKVRAMRPSTALSVTAGAFFRRRPRLPYSLDSRCARHERS